VETTELTVPGAGPDLKGLPLRPPGNFKRPSRFSWDSLKRMFRFWYLKLLRIRDNPHNVAMGLSLGVFVGCLPIIPLQTVTALVLAFLLRCSKLAAALGTWITNPLYAPFVYYGMYLLGRTIIPVGKKEFEPEELTLLNIVNLGWDFLLLMLAGGIVVGLVLAFLTYAVSVRMVYVYRRKRALRIKLKRSRPR